MEEWRKRLALASDEAISHAIGNTAQLAINVESGNRAMPRMCHESRFPFFKHLSLKDEFHTDAFSPSARSTQNHACAQMITGKGTGHWEVYPTSKESCSLRSLQDFVRNVGMPPTLKRHNAKT